jgi:hypothetical protein
MAAGVFHFFTCRICGDEAHPNAPSLNPFAQFYVHTREYASWKPKPPPDGFKSYDHRAKL